MYKRALSLLVAVLCLFLSVAHGEESFSMAGYDGEDSTHEWATNGFFERMKERTGLSFTFTQYNKIERWQAAKEQMFASGELPDVLFKAALTSEELIRYTDSGQLIDLLPLLPDNAPNLWALLKENPQWLEAITLPNGKVGALSALQEIPAQDILWINQDWLSRLKLSMPTDMASLREVLTAFRDSDPNGNGKNDEVPLAFLGPWELKLFSHAYGVVANDYNIYLDEGGKVCFWPEEDSFIELASDLRTLYQEKLLAQDGFQTSDVLRGLTGEDETLRYGAFFAPTPATLLNYEQTKSYAAVMPFAYGGKQIYRDLFGQVGRGAFAITSACADPARMLRWVDILYTQEGAVEAMVGKEGDAYLLTEDGDWQWKGGTESMNTTRLNALSIYDTGEMPWLFPQAFYQHYADPTIRRITEDMTRFDQYVVKPFPVYTLTLEQRAQVQPLQNALGRYVDESLARFVLGETELSPEAIADFRAQLKSLGADEMISFWQAVADQ